MSSYVNDHTELFPIQSEDEYLASDPTYAQFVARLHDETMSEQEEAQARHINQLFDRMFGM